MSTHKASRKKRRRAVQLNGLDEQPKPSHAKPSARDAILAWLLWLPNDADPRQAALVELERLANRGESTEQVRELQTFFAEIAFSETPKA